MNNNTLFMLKAWNEFKNSDEYMSKLNSFPQNNILYLVDSSKLEPVFIFILFIQMK